MSKIAKLSYKRIEKDKKTARKVLEKLERETAEWKLSKERAKELWKDHYGEEIDEAGRPAAVHFHLE
jgi:hypothetical protein